MAKKEVRIAPAAQGRGWQVVAPGQPAGTARVFKTKRAAIAYALVSERSARVAEGGVRALQTTGRVKIKKAASNRSGKTTTKRQRVAAGKTTASKTARLVKQSQTEYDHDQQPGPSFRKLMQNAAKLNKDALDRLAK
ncbi:hypothetical protein SacmaDRAFT_3960 [Saccharomonospora marina XMU15]|uniref:Uncharacterized protein n=1 Tax=Saccharomonospora marina XMU15 TaxID=882083 RepID=H5X3T9_9PSEU|nr:hypothetical protein [Saccharomonospora marina]EHR52157.1 hypothetical protein SacmaDRAFT_3960 [Saccharomonospora marina XMU15]